MAISRRDFFVEMFAKTVQNVSKLVPDNLSNLLGIESKKPLTTEESAFALANRQRKKSVFSFLNPNNLPNNSSTLSGDKSKHR
jgi:hypothetical protein